MSQKERESKYFEYKKEMEALSDEELIERHEKYLTSSICEKLYKIAYGDNS